MFPVNKTSAKMAASETENAIRTRRVTNALVSGTFKPGSAEDLNVIAKLFVRTGRGSSGSLSSSNVWQYFAPLYGAYYFLYIQQFKA